MLASEQTDDLRLLTEAAQEAGKLALRFWKQNPDHWDKGGGAGPVSEADLAVNTLLADMLQSQRPDYGWLSEESQDEPSRLLQKRCFIIDPIDGTRAFLAGDSSFAHALAITENEEVVAGVVYLPALGLTYAATKAGPATCNGSPIGPTSAQHIEKTSLLTSKASDEPQHWKAGRPGYIRSFRPSLAWRLCLVAEGRFDATLSLRPVWDWDIAAASLVATRSGALATNGHGGALLFNTASAQNAGLLVAGPQLHRQYLAALNTQTGI